MLSYALSGGGTIVYSSIHKLLPCLLRLSGRDNSELPKKKRRLQKMKQNAEPPIMSNNGKAEPQKQEHQHHCVSFAHRKGTTPSTVKVYGDGDSEEMTEAQLKNYVIEDPTRKLTRYARYVGCEIYRDFPYKVTSMEDGVCCLISTSYVDTLLVQETIAEGATIARHDCYPPIGESLRN